MTQGASSARLWLAALVILLLAAPFAVYPIVLMKVLCFALFASAFNLTLGYTGILSFGHAAFFGWAAYVGAHAVKVWGMPPELGILAGTAAAAVLGLAFGWLAIRRQGIYFAMITLALAQMMFQVAVDVPFTHGEDGIQGVPRGVLFGVFDLAQPFTMYYAVLAVCVAGFALIYRAIHSPFGQVLKAIRENEPRAISLGYRVDQYKLLAFVLSAALAGLAGATKALVFQLASLTDVTWQMSGEVILITLLGGVGTVFGPVVGALIWVSLETYLDVLIDALKMLLTIFGVKAEPGNSGSWVGVVQGAVFVIVVLAFRKGVVGEVAERLKRRGDAINSATSASAASPD
jgi:branched-chain amino acid transport system permease protein